MGMPFQNEVVGGTTLVIPAIQSPNFSVAAQTGWQIAQNGIATLYSLDLSGGTLVIAAGSGGILVYSGTPASGNLIGSWASQPGVDPYGNSYPAGLAVGGTSMPQVQLIPASGTGAASVALPSNAGDEAIVPAVSGGTLNSGAANQQPYLSITGPANSNDTNRANFTLQMTAASDDGTIAPGLALTDSYGNDYLVIAGSTGGAPEMGIGMTFSGNTPVSASAVQAFLNGALVTYGVSSGGQVVQTFTSTQNWTCPTGVTTLSKVEIWGAGGGGGGGSAPNQWGDGGAGGGGGGYTVATNVASTALKVYAITVGAGGFGGGPGTPNGSAAPNGGAGASSSFPADSGTLTSGGGSGGTGGHNGHIGGAGGTGTHTGGTGGSASTDGTDTGGGGGGGSGGPTTGGTGGGGTFSRAPGSGGPAGGSPGGLGGGGGWGSNADNGTSGGNGNYPGGGGGGGGGGSDAHTWSGGVGQNGMVRITYTTPGSTAIEASVASSSGTDPGGNTYPAGFQGPITAVQPGSSPSTPEVWHAISLVSGLTGTMRVKRLAESNFVVIDAELSFTYSGSAQTFTCGSLPAGYYPTAGRQYPVVVTGTPSGITATDPRLFVGTSGGIQIIVPSGSGSASASFTQVVPLD